MSICVYINTSHMYVQSTKNWTNGNCGYVALPCVNCKFLCLCVYTEYDQLSSLYLLQGYIYCFVNMLRLSESRRLSVTETWSTTVPLLHFINPTEIDNFLMSKIDYLLARLFVIILFIHVIEFQIIQSLLVSIYQCIRYLQSD